MPAPKKYPDPEIGTVFGKGVVTGLVHFRRSPQRKNYERGAVMVCECGQQYLAELAALYTDDRKSCGAQKCRGRSGLLAVPRGWAQHPLKQT